MEEGAVVSVRMREAVCSDCRAADESCSTKLSGLRSRSQWHCVMLPSFSVLQHKCIHYATSTYKTAGDHAWC